MGLIRGFLAPFRGATFVARHGLWGYLILPLIINLALAGAAGWVSVRFLAAKLQDRLAIVSSAFVSWLVFALVASLLALLLFLVFQPLIGAPFVDLLSEKTESVVRGRVPTVGFFRSAWKAALHGLLKAVLYAGALAAVAILGAVSGVGGAFGVALYALFLAFDGYDYPLSRRGISFAGKWRYLALHPGQTLGYCCGASVLYLVPLAALVAPAFAAVGATLTYLDSEPPTPDQAESVAKQEGKTE